MKKLILLLALVLLGSWTMVDSADARCHGWRVRGKCSVFRLRHHCGHRLFKHRYKRVKKHCHTPASTEPAGEVKVPYEAAPVPDPKPEP